MTPPPTRELIVAGIMSGTSADGIDIALTRITPSTDLPRITLLAHEHLPYPADLRALTLRIMEGAPTTAAELSRLNWRLGDLYAEAIAHTATKHNIQPDLIGLHGQTIYHQPTAEDFLGSPTRATWQTGEPAVIAERLRIPVVSDLRPADLAAGGQGAPLVPMLDLFLFQSQTTNRILLNLGGIANVTVIPAAAAIDQVIAFDTGPANMVIDALMLRLTGRAFDCGGQTAARGTIQQQALADLLRAPYYAALPPKSCGREQFGSPFVDRLTDLCKQNPVTQADLVATATALTVASILHASETHCTPHLNPAFPTEMIAAGGGTHNAFLMRQLREGLATQHIALTTTDAHGIPSEAKEAVAFALLAWLTWHRRPGNIPSATGATRPVILGKITQTL